MHDSPSRLAVAILLLAGFLTLILSFSAAAGMQPAGLSDPLLVPLAWHRHLWAAMIGGSLLVAVYVPRIRLAAATAAVLDKGAFLAVSWATGSPLDTRLGLDAAVLLVLVPALIVLGRLAWREARWEGVLPLRTEA
ncbi:MAG: hypothetical protein EOO54_16460 [Haliea sp.]|nr:MAG: hypothetical protein EOO54_16460 [Haliea sp.]